MNERQTFSIDFVIRKCKGNKTKAHIYARITVDGATPAEISINEKIIANDWNSEKEEVKGRGMEIAAINEHISDVRFRIKQKYRELERYEEIITAQSVKAAYEGVQTKLKGHKLRELLKFYKEIWEPKLKDGGFKNYKTTIKYIELYLESIAPGHDVYLSQVNGEFATKFEHHIRTTPIKDFDPCKGNGVGKHIQRFKRILNWAEEDLKWLTVNLVKGYSCPLKKSRRKKLDIQELVILENKKFVDPTLLYIKDLFLYSCYTGLAFVDAMALAESDFEFNLDDTVWCKIYRTKSNELCAVPILRSAANILEYYREDAAKNGRATIFPKVSNQHVNSNLKTMQAACEISTLLTFHVARHTFGKTVALKNGIPLETVQMMMGHTKISTTQIYADVDEEKILKDMSGLEDKLDKKRRIVVLNNEKANFAAAQKE
ncbi:MAG: site-specific integrase [Chitinophagaceae bacterium]